MENSENNKKTGGIEAVVNAVNALEKGSPVDRAKNFIRRLLDGDMFYIPMLYAGEFPGLCYDDTVHYTKEAACKINDAIDNDSIREGRQMHFRFARNRQTGEEYLPFFTTIEGLRAVFPSSEARICRAGKEVVIDFAHECSGIILDLDVPIGNHFLVIHGLDLRGWD